MHSSITSEPFKKDLFLKKTFSGCQAAEVALTLTVKPAVVEIFVNEIKLFGNDSGDRLKSTEKQALVWQRFRIRCIKWFF